MNTLKQTRRGPGHSRWAFMHASLLLLSNPFGAACSSSSAAALGRSFLGRLDLSLSVSSSLIQVVRGIPPGLRLFLQTPASPPGNNPFGCRLCCPGCRCLPLPGGLFLLCLFWLLCTAILSFIRIFRSTGSCLLARGCPAGSCSADRSGCVGGCFLTGEQQQQGPSMRKLSCGRCAGGRVHCYDAGGALHLQNLSTGAGTSPAAACSDIFCTSGT